MSFLSPLAALGALIAIPIILLYILRLRRRETVVSSNFLWQQILRDREANTPWQRLRRNILLILQLLILALLVFALMRPAQVVPTITASKTVILLDASASMNATDINGDTRFEEAQRQANLLLNDLSIDDEIAIIRVAESAEPLIPYTNNLLDARAAIFDAEPGQGRGDWSTALTLAAAGAQGADNFSIIIISDGGIERAGQLPENIPAPIIVPIGESASNLAITALATRTLPGQSPQLFAQIQNYDDIANEVSLLLRLDGELWDSVSLTISAASSQSLFFEINQPFTTIQAELVLDDTVIDYLESDNTAYSVARENSTRRILLLSNQRNIFLEEVLRSLPNVQVFTGDVNNDILPSTPYDLYIFNGYLPATLPDADMLILNPPRSSDIFTVGDESTQTSNVSLASTSHPLAAFLAVESINIWAFRPVRDTERWAVPIVSSNGGDLIIAGENRGRQIALINFNLLDSDFPLQIAFPIFMSNMIEWATPANVISGGISVNVGDVIRLNPPLDATSVAILLPDGTTRNIAITSDTLSFSETQQSGFYTIRITTDASTTDSQFAVNLFGTNESNIAPIPDSQINLGGGRLAEDAEEQLGFREWWQPVLLIALLILLYEWHLYFKRLRVPDDLETDLRRTTARN